MTTQIAIIDPYINGPSVNCFNRLVQLLNVPATYHQPSEFGIESLRQSSKQHKGYIVLGSASNVTEPLPWHKPLGEFLVEELRQNKPVFGCCFGHQLLCHALGAEVDYYSQDQYQFMGKRKVTMLKSFHGFKQGEEFELAVTHRQVVKHLPDELISVGLGLNNDVVIHSTLPFLGTQAHPEASAHFCQTDITNLTAEEIDRVQRDGGNMILRFFQHFGVT
jgi:GMP synthase-like glutamine amidotransferase